ncbi:MAG TPA: nitroreductase family deazaflavin-dependent oxidoreductase [Amycolatopsis sp.]|jgi:deazaflavin-dependent oxidoreductase (nitroreductase family)|nr:nitroreductase family deazaflavin-dependent oxidoreductase [Amycolatopsis sp.]
MVVSRRVARFNKVATNRVLGQFTPFLPGFGTVVHNGRRSGRVYHTPVNIFRASDGYVIALPYGPESDWVRNVLAADGCEVVTRGRTVKLTKPRLVHEAKCAELPTPVRQILELAGVADFLHLEPAQPSR